MEVNDRPEQSKARSQKNWTLRYFAALLGIGVVWWWVAPLIGMGTVGLLFGFVIGSTVLLAIVGSWSSDAGPGRILGLLVASFVVVCILLFAETHLLARFLLMYPPPRPMFHNHFGENEHTLLPIWWRPRPIRDREGNWCWADFDDNVLAIVVTGDATGARFSPIRCGMTETRFKAGPDSGETYVTVSRSTNRLIVILPDATHHAFPLSPGTATSFEEELLSAGWQNTLGTVRGKIEEGDRSRFDEFVGPHAKRAP